MSETKTAKAMLPDADDIAENKTETHCREQNGKSRRKAKQIQISQIPLKMTDARTVHKLQGKSLENFLV